MGPLAQPTPTAGSTAIDRTAAPDTDRAPSASLEMTGITVAFASTLGAGVLVSAVAVGVLQGSLTLLGYLLGDFLSPAQIDGITATGGVILLALGLRLMRVRQIPVGNLLPALLLAPALVWAVGSLA